MRLPATTALSPGQLLKLDIMTNGMAIRPAAREVMQGAGPSKRPVTLADYASTSGVSLRLPGDIWVNAPIAEFNANFVSAPVAELDWVDGGFVLRSDELELVAQPVPVPAYHDMVNELGEPVTSYAITHTDRVRISPVQGCALTCQFCDLPYEFRYATKRVEGLVQSVATALSDPVLPARHVLISGGTPRIADYGYENEVYERVCRSFPGIEVDVMMLPMPGLLDAKRLWSAGVRGLSINLELYDETAARALMAGKARLTRQVVLDFIADAVAVFGPGRVRSLVLVGLEDLDDTLRAVGCLSERGCDPVLSAFRPDPSTPLRNRRPPASSLLAEAYAKSRDIVDRFPEVRLGPRCIPCQHNTLTFPDGTDAYYVTP